MNRTPERLVLVLDAPVHRTLRELEGHYRTRDVESWDELEAALAGAAPSTVALVNPYSGRARGEGPSPRLRELVWRRPSTPVVVALHVHPERLDDIVALLAWGISEMIDLELENNPKAALPRLRGAHARPFKRRMETELLQYASDYAATLVRAACEVAVDGGGAPELAARFGVEPRTVGAWCRREALPPPRRLQAWMRVLLAAWLLEEPGRSVLNAARSAGYANDHALRRAMRELAGGDPSTLPREQLFETAAARMNDELRVLRERLRERRRTGRVTARDFY
ncbi:MAG TPA: helix-turn-helix domain-containing protein [Longimicrobium sp.]|jgi:methylphosphotriester-DNA--protein-cysteine methyltransferase